MNSLLKLPKDQVAALRPETLETYLRARGWVNDPVNSSADVGAFRYPSEPDAEALVPRRRSFGDYALRVGDVLAAVAAVEQRRVWDVFAELVNSSVPPDQTSNHASSPQNGSGTVSGASVQREANPKVND